jgi:hypothetical protein
MPRSDIGDIQPMNHIASNIVLALAAATTTKTAGGKWGRIRDHLNTLSGLCSSAPDVSKNVLEIMKQLNVLMSCAVIKTGIWKRDKSKYLIKQIVEIRDAVYNVRESNRDDSDQSVDYNLSVSGQDLYFARKDLAKDATTHLDLQDHLKDPLVAPINKGLRLQYTGADGYPKFVAKNDTSKLQEALSGFGARGNVNRRQRLNSKQRLISSINQHSNFICYTGADGYPKFVAKNDASKLQEALSGFEARGNSSRKQRLISRINQHSNFICYTDADGKARVVGKDHASLEDVIIDLQSAHESRHLQSLLSDIEQHLKLKPLYSNGNTAVQLVPLADYTHLWWKNLLDGDIHNVLWENENQGYYKAPQGEDRDPSLVYPSDRVTYNFEDGSDAPIVLQDLHGNVMLAISLLVRAGVIEIPQQDFEVLAKQYFALLYLQANQHLQSEDIDINAKISELRSHIQETIGKFHNPDEPKFSIDPEKAKRVRCIGDITGDRGASDGFINQLFSNFTVDDGFTIYASNHGDLSQVVLGALTFPSEGPQPRTVDDQASQLVQQLNSINPGQNFDRFARSLLQKFTDGSNARSAANCAITLAPDALYPMQGNSLLQDLYSIYCADGDNKQSIATSWLKDKSNLDASTKFVEYDPEREILYSHAPAPVECFLRVAMQLAEGLPGVELSAIAPEFAGSCTTDEDITQYVEDFVSQGMHKDEFGKICEFINQQYTEYLKSPSKTELSKVFAAKLSYDAELQIPGRNGWSKAISESPAYCAVWMRQRDAGAHKFCGERLKRVVGHDGQRLRSTPENSVDVFDGFVGKVLLSRGRDGTVTMLVDEDRTLDTASPRGIILVNKSELAMAPAPPRHGPSQHHAPLVGQGGEIFNRPRTAGIGDADSQTLDHHKSRPGGGISSS